MKLEDINYVANAHNNHPVKPRKAYRKWDGKTPYYIHPVWCTATLATEKNLDDKTKEEGIQTLLYHDVLEDTTQKLPDGLSERVKELIRYMTFESFDEEIIKVWEKPIEIKLYKVYDKVSNLMDGYWMNDAKRKQYEEYTQKLVDEVEKHYGELNITKIARAIMKSKPTNL